MDLKQFTLLIGVACLPGMTTAATVYRTISKVEAISVDCPEGKQATPINNVNCFKSISSRFIIVSFIFLAAK